MSHSIPDLRDNHDESSPLPDGNGKVYRKGLTVQCWYDHDTLGRPFDNSPQAAATLCGSGRETWTFPDEEQAKRCYGDLTSQEKDGK